MATRAAIPFRVSESPSEVELVAKYFRVLSDPTRLAILKLLVAGGERSVGEIVAALGHAQPKISNHLACLRWCGFVDARREHRMVYYRIADERVLELLELGEAMLADNACRGLSADRGNARMSKGRTRRERKAGVAGWPRTASAPGAATPRA